MKTLTIFGETALVKGKKSEQFNEIGLRKLLRALICDLTLKLFKFEMFMCALLICYISFNPICPGLFERT